MKVRAIIAEPRSWYTMSDSRAMACAFNVRVNKCLAKPAFSLVLI